MIHPTEKQRTAKAKFWQAFDRNPLLGKPEALSGPQICKMSGSQTIYKWIKESEEFYNWFFDKDYARTVLKSGLEIAASTLIEICQSPTSRETPAATRVKAAESLLKLGGISEKTAGDSNSVDSLSEEDLEKLISTTEKNLKVVNNGKKTV